MDRQWKFKEQDIDMSIDQSARSAKFNKELYLENFGVDLQIPTFFVIDSHLWQKDPNYIFKFVKYVLPSKNYKTIQHHYDGHATVSTY